jgi:uncharacterized protein (DUF433 family)
MDGPGLYFLASAMSPRNDWQEHLTLCAGDLCARGTRIPVTLILDNLAGGKPREEILQTWPSLHPEHIDAALAYASELAHEKRLLRLDAAGSATM